jgi:hypothetical protein
MLLFLKENLSGLELPMETCDAALWLHEDEGTTASLVSENGPEVHTTSQEQWRIFVVAGPGVWVARHLDKDKGIRKTTVTIKEVEGKWVMSIG